MKKGQPEPKSDWLSSITRIFSTFAVIFVFGFFVLPKMQMHFSRNSERNQTDAEGMRRVEAAGGWSVLEQSCLTLASNKVAELGTAPFYWRGHDTSALPDALQKLKPREIRLEANEAGIPIMRVKLAGGHRTGYYDSPYYGVWVVCTNLPDYVPAVKPHDFGRRGLFERKGPMIFEVR